MDQIGKLERFKKSIYDEIDAKVHDIQHAAHSEQEDALTKEAEKAFLKYSQMLQKRSAEIRKEQKRIVASYGLASKRDILETRNELTRLIFSNVAIRLKEYTKTKEYDQYLLEKISSFSKENNLSDVVINVNENDFTKTAEIKKAYSLPCEVVVDKDINFGGFSIVNKKNSTFFDETLDAKLDDQKTYFIQNSEFAL